ncbi:hypothetical protein [Rhodococcus marinonascens]|uniref:hypothetical protein n=1 Tax=Rhodococcus marinonascens TaxID=38311 RepID=UPI00093402E7|nr:hypothetical protein [Rhodococcus marinonascens]
MTTHLSPSLSQKLERMRDFYHHRNEPRLSLQAVATMAGRHLSRPVPAELLEKAASGEVRELPRDVADALCDAMGTDRSYLQPGSGLDIDLDQRLRLWIEIRDRGIDHFAARATSVTRDELEELIAHIQTMPLAADDNAKATRG